MDISKDLMDKAIANKSRNRDGVLSYIRERFQKSLKKTLGRDVDMFCTFERGKGNPHLHGSALLYTHEAADSEAKKPKTFKAAFNKICGERTEGEKKAGHNIGELTLKSRINSIQERGLLNGTVNWGMYATKDAGKDLAVSYALNKFTQWHYEEIQIEYKRLFDESWKTYGVGFDIDSLKADIFPPKNAPKTLYIFPPKIAPIIEG